MSSSLRTKVSIFVTIAIVAISAVSTILFTRASRLGIERQVIARGSALADSLSKAVAEGFASEDLSLIKKAASIVHAEDVMQVQVFSNIWQAVDAYPFKGLNDPPEPEAIAHFETSGKIFHMKTFASYIFYVPITIKPLETAPPLTIGYAKLQLSTIEALQAMSEAVIATVTASAVITLLAILSINLLIRRLVISPVVQLHRSVSRYKNGLLPEAVLVESEDEIGRLSAEFNKMSRAVRERQEILIESEKRIKYLFERVEHAIFSLDEHGVVLEGNTTFREFIGETRNFCDLFTADSRQRQHSLWCLQSAMRENLVNSEQRLAGRQGELIVLLSLYPEFDSEGNVEGFDGYFVDITSRKRTEEALAEEKERLAITLRSIGDGVITTDIEGKVILINKVAEHLTGWTQEEAAGKPVQDVFYIINEKTGERCENPVSKVLKTGGIVGLANHTALVSKDGTQRVIADSGAPIRDSESRVIGVVLVFRDITEKTRMEEDFQRAQRLESIGILAGGIAHDFNNLLTGIIGNISLAKTSASPSDDVYRSLQEAEKATLRAKDLTNQLLTFSKGGQPIKKIASIAAVIRDSAAFVLRGSNVSCEFSITDDLWPVEIDEGQMNQVVNNLVLNAAQSMPEGGTVRISCTNETIGARQALPPGRHVKISVKDHGCGIPEENLKKIFDPYFTTRQKGSGLGLTITHSIIKSHDGHIEVESTPGVGSTFHVYLPASEHEADKSYAAGGQILAGTGRVLVMDDEPVVRTVAGRMLARLGYEVRYAEDGLKAIELYKKAAEALIPFDAVMMDLTIPGGMGGKEAARKLLEFDPNAKIIVSSGYSNDPVLSNFAEYGFRGAAVKPYTMETLSEVVHRVLKS